MRRHGLGASATFALTLAFTIAVRERSVAQTPQTISLYAAGSLKGALTELAQAFTKQTGIVVNQTYGSSGTLRARIENGDAADVFASADVESPQRLAREGKAGPVTVFTHNRMCLLVKSATVAKRSVIEVMLDPAVRLVTSTPQADPAGDYAERIFGAIDAQRPGSSAILDAKALRLVGGRDAVPIPPSADAGTFLLLTANRGDAFLAYCSGFGTATTAHPAELQSLEMPPALAVRADYGLTLLSGAPEAAQRFRSFILSDQGQGTLMKYGFSP